MLPNINRYRKPIRLKDFDYSLPGEYFVTICTFDHEYLFGEIVNEEMRLNAAGCIAEKYWIDIPNHFPDVTLDEFVIMPNHVHGIIVISECRDLINQIPTENFPLMNNPKITLGKIIRQYKARTSKYIHDLGIADFRWQRGYYDRIILNDKELNNVRDYIANNVLKWYFDTENPQNFPK